MRNIFILTLLCAATAAAQYQALPATPNYPALAQTINGKPNMSSGSGVPTANCTAFLDLYTDTATNNIYGCPQTNTWALWAYGTTFTNSEHAIGGCQLFPDNHWVNVDVSSNYIDYGSPTWVATLATGWPTVSNATWSSGTATLTVSTTAGITTGNSLTVTGINPNGYNSNSSTGGYTTLTVVDGTHLSYSLASNPGSYVSGGNVATSAGSRMGLNNGMDINLATNSTSTPAYKLLLPTNTWESDIGAFPITGSMIVEGGGTVATPGSCGDCHLLVLNTDTCTAYEGYNIQTTSPPYVFGGGGNGGSVAIWNLYSNNLRLNYTTPAFNGNITDTAGITGADAGGLPVIATILTHAELYAGCPGGVGTCTPIKHALRITWANGGGNGGFVWPATHASSSAKIPLGTRFVLPSGYSGTCQNFDNIGQNFSSYSPAASLIWTLQHYGAISADYGASTKLTADADTAWTSGGTTDLSVINLWTHCILGQDLVVVRETPTQGINSGAIK